MKTRWMSTTWKILVLDDGPQRVLDDPRERLLQTAIPRVPTMTGPIGEESAARCDLGHLRTHN